MKSNDLDRYYPETTRTPLRHLAQRITTGTAPVMLKTPILGVVNVNTDNSSEGVVRFGRMAPTLSVSNIEQSTDFYTNHLGFRKVFENGSPVGFVILKRDHAELHLSLSKTHKGSTQNVAHLMVSDAFALYDQLVAANVKIIKAIRDADFGLRCFVFSDPDGNRIDVGQSVAAGD